MTPRALPAAYTLFTRLLALRDWFAARRPKKARLGLEAMEDRVVPTISGYVWYDVNGNGTKDSGEGVVAGGATLDLYETGVGYTGLTTSTDSYGYYQFNPTGPGPYDVQFMDPAGYGYSTAVNSSGLATPSGGVADFGLVGSGQMPGGTLSIAGHAWHDADADGVKDANEWWADGIVGVSLWQGGNSVETGVPSLSGGV